MKNVIIFLAWKCQFEQKFQTILECIIQKFEVQNPTNTYLQSKS